MLQLMGKGADIHAGAVGFGLTNFAAPYMMPGI